MKRIKLKKLLKPETKVLIKKLTAFSHSPVRILDADGRLLLDNNISDPSISSPISLNGYILGHVQGEPLGLVIADMLSQMAQKEFEKKTIARETLAVYKEINMLYNLSEKMTVSLEVTEMVRLIAQEAYRLIHCDHASVMLYNQKANLLEIETVEGDCCSGEMHLAPGEGLAGHIFLSGKGEIINDTASDFRFVKGLLPIRSMLCVPLKTQKEVIGVINLSTQKPSRFDASDLKLASVLASQAAVAIENAKLFNTLEQKVLERTLQLTRTNERLLDEIKERQRTQNRLDGELAEAAAYVKTVIPRPIKKGPVMVDWRFVPSASLGGDLFGYHWLDEDHLGIYLLDVSGHGVGAALLSVSIINVLRSQALPHTEFKDPRGVLKALNNMFLAERHNDLFFTLWYGVYHRADRVLEYASGGHPPALLLCDSSAAGQSAIRLSTPNFVIGGRPNLNYQKKTQQIPHGSRLYIYTDGVYEVSQSDGSLWGLDDFLTFMSQTTSGTSSALDELLTYVRKMNPQAHFEDDFTILEIVFN
jgi:serine phosphatase RsbU (regulator of sigma subunit)